MRSIAIASAVVLAAVLLVGAASANPLVLWYLRDSPTSAPNGVWDDQWSGGAVTPPGEIVLPEDPGYNPDCYEFEELNKFARIGLDGEAMRAYLDPTFLGTQVGGTATGSFAFRQTTPEVSTVCVELYKVGPYGENPEFVGMDCVELVEIASWPPTIYPVALGTVPQMEMYGERFMVVISSDGQYTDLVWDCLAWDGWIQLPEDDPFNPVQTMSWSTIKAMYE